jgi:hypothetical protein
MLLTDVLLAIAQDTCPFFSTSEIDIQMPASSHSFRTAYNSLTHGFPLPPDMSRSEDVLLLLVALLADIVYYQCTFPATPFTSQVEPHTTLSVPSERLRLTDSLRGALLRWERYFGSSSRGDVLMLYHLACMKLLTPEILMPKRPFGSGQHRSGQPPPDEAISSAWQVLDLSENVLANDTQRLSVWIPISIFASAAVVWEGMSSSKDNMGKHGRLRILTMFQEKLSQLPWPCCDRMNAELGRLTKARSSG